MCNIKNLHITAHIYERKRNNIGLGKIEKMKFEISSLFHWILHSKIHMLITSEFF